MNSCTSRHDKNTKKYVTGNTYQGQSTDPKTASIPSKFQTVVISNRDRRGFNVQAKRFNYDLTLSDNPGPGRYSNKHASIEKYSTSFSKKGTGSFASQSSRLEKLRYRPGPTAATYTLPSLLTTRNDFKKNKITSSFNPPVTDFDKDNELLRRCNIAPAPNTYFKDTERPKKKYVIGEQKAFLTTARRTTQGPTPNNPSPCHYNIREGLTKRHIPAHVSAFNSNTKRGKNMEDGVPGPGTYKPGEPVTKPYQLLMPRKHYLCLSAPAMATAPSVQPPGPGAYEVVNYEGVEKHAMSSGVFLSNTSRWNNEIRASAGAPGPTTYRPNAVGKQSFNFNIFKRWVPV